MNQFLASHFEAIPLGYSLLQTQNQIASWLAAAGWQQIAQVDTNYTDFIPPVSESIGTSKFREVVRIYYTNTTITIGSYMTSIANAYPQSIRLTAKTGGAVAAAVTIDGVTVTGAVGSAGSTANDNLRELFYALKDSVNATITGWDHWYNGTDTIICTNKTITTNKVCSVNANVNYFAQDAPVLSGARSGWANVDSSFGYPVTIDLTNGFIIYMEIWSRSFSIATKCLAGFTGPIFACYVDHADAVAATPSTGKCTPIELVVGNSGSDGTAAVGRVTHWWTTSNGWGNRSVSSVETTSRTNSYETVPDWNPFTGGSTPLEASDSGLAWGYYMGNDVALQMTFGKLATVASASALDGYKVAGVGLMGALHALDTSYMNAVRFVPTLILDGVNKWSGAEPNEACVMAVSVPPTVNGTGVTLQQALDSTTAYTSITLSGTTGLSASGGGFVIGTEEFTYTGLSGGTTATGVTRAQNGTTAARHFIGDTVRPVTWYMKLNYGAICNGNTKPS